MTKPIWPPFTTYVIQVVISLLKKRGVQLHGRGQHTQCRSEALRIGMIRESLPHMIDMVVSLFEEGSDMVIIHGVVDNIAIAT